MITSSTFRTVSRQRKQEITRISNNLEIAFSHKKVTIVDRGLLKQVTKLQHGPATRGSSAKYVMTNAVVGKMS